MGCLVNIFIHFDNLVLHCWLLVLGKMGVYVVGCALHASSFMLIASAMYTSVDDSLSMSQD